MSPPPVREDPRLHPGRLPVLPSAATYLLQAFAGDDMEFAELAATVERVPMVALRVLALANSVWSAPVAPITSLEIACRRLGFGVVRSLSIALSLAERFNPAECPPFDYQLFWGSSLLRAEAAEHVARECGGDQQTARTAALLSNLGLLWLADSLPRETAEALRAVSEAGGGYANDAVRACCGLGIDEASHRLAEHWRLPDEIRVALANQYLADVEAHPHAVSQSVAISTSLVRALTHGEGLDASADPLLRCRLSVDIHVGETFAQLERDYPRALSMAKALFGT